MAQGLYDPRAEHDACGVGFVVHMKGQRSHDIVRKALQVLINLEHRGACGCEANTGDGAGILIQTPDAFLRKVGLVHAARRPGAYGAGLVFLPRDERDREAIKDADRDGSSRRKARRCSAGATCRPTTACSATAPTATQPVFQQVFIGVAARRSTDRASTLRFERKLYVIRKRIEHAVDKLDAQTRSRAASSTSSACRRTR